MPNSNAKTYRFPNAVVSIGDFWLVWQSPLPVRAGVTHHLTDDCRCLGHNLRNLDCPIHGGYSS